MVGFLGHSNLSGIKLYHALSFKILFDLIKKKVYWKGLEENGDINLRV